MYINEQYKDLDLLEKETYCHIARDGSITQKEELVLVEHVMDVYINERLTMKLICTPQHLTELVLGRLFTEGIISSTEDVAGIYICEHGRRAKVTLADHLAKENGNYVELTPACCTGNRILNDYFLKQKDVYPVQPIPWESDWVFRLADRFAEGMPLHQETWATHSCLLAKGETLLFACEDIGRHNALDKAIGYALRNGIDLRQCLVYSSGRVPTDMTLKAIRAGIPIMASKASPTHEAVELAREYDLTLVCAARRDRMKQYAGSAADDEWKGKRNE